MLFPDNALFSLSFGYSACREAHVPKSDQPNSEGNTYTFDAFSIMPKSTEILGHLLNARPIAEFSILVFKSSDISLKGSLTSGSNSSNAATIFFTFQIKIPAFHKNSPVAKNRSAVARLGFSVNVFTL